MDEFTYKGVPEGHIVLAACNDDIFTKLSYKTKRWFEDMGSKDIFNVKYR